MTNALRTHFDKYDISLAYLYSRKIDQSLFRETKIFKQIKKKKKKKNSETSARTRTRNIISFKIDYRLDPLDSGSKCFLRATTCHGYMKNFSLGRRKFEKGPVCYRATEAYTSPFSPFPFLPGRGRKIYVRIIFDDESRFKKKKRIARHEF